MRGDWIDDAEHAYNALNGRRFRDRDAAIDAYVRAVREWGRETWKLADTDLRMILDYVPVRDMSGRYAMTFRLVNIEKGGHETELGTVRALFADDAGATFDLGKVKVRVDSCVSLTS